MREVRDLDERQYIDTTYRLLAPGEDLAKGFVGKPLTSVIEKTYRRNVLENTNWPNEPASGWITPGNWFESVKDIVRTTVLVKYLDGVEQVTALLASIAAEFDAIAEISPEARDEGYYAVHVTLLTRLTIPGEQWEPRSTVVPIEVQVTTQVQELIPALTHKFYESRRLAQRDDTRKWQWDYRSEEFVPNYLGHILHYVEGMIMEVRDRQEQSAK